MTLRELEPKKFNRHVVMSWKLMNYLVSHIAEETFVAHLLPIEGIEYNCLSLVVRDSDGHVGVPILLNRNGQSGFVMDKVWTRIRRDGVEVVGDEMIRLCRLTPLDLPRETSVTRTCEKVMNWINAHKNENYFVGVSNDPGCNRELEHSWSANLPEVIWPVFEHGPEIIMGIDGVVMVRLNQIDETIKIESQESEKEMKKVMNVKKESAEYRDLKHGLDGWGKLNDRKHVWTEIEAVIETLKESLGEISRVHVPPERNYLAVTFVEKPKKVGAYIEVGHVNHIVELKGSYPLENDPGYWQTRLSTFNEGTVKPGESIVERELCPNCSIEVSKYGECACGWRPDGAGTSS